MESTNPATLRLDQDTFLLLAVSLYQGQSGVCLFSQKPYNQKTHAVTQVKPFKKSSQEHNQ